MDKQGENRIVLVNETSSLKPVFDHRLLGSNTRPSGSGLGAALADLTRGRALLGAYLGTGFVNFTLAHLFGTRRLRSWRSPS